MITTQPRRPAPDPQDAAQHRSDALARLHSEMTALFGIMPVPFMVRQSTPAEDAEIEAQFDNMPV